MIEHECPNCKKQIELPWYRWSFKAICPKCSCFLWVEFDFVLMDDYDEWDIYDLKQITKEEYNALPNN